MSAIKPVAVVTGASSGIGSVYADRLAARGYDLVLVARRADRLQALADRLTTTFGTKIRVVGADLTREEDLTTVENLLKTDPAIALLVNNAGNGKLGSTTEMTEADVLSTIALNITALTRLSLAALPAFLARKSGAIINISSAVALHALPIASLYSGAKAYVLNFSRGLAEEVAASGVRIQAVLPAGTATEFYDHSGIPLSAFDPAVVMTTENLVDAALAGFDQGEAVTMPSVHDLGLWEEFEAARAKLFAATQNGAPAPRYHISSLMTSGLR